ncbi:unnamed protein product [Oppiella nova]|uniref:Uncharacterized protein n=1 Tax=Oppiella nova TaxID=334625 RepID=A0A7R9M246_9ACAR|nr:unnamed protein product [Oppiella nova]CAG2169294.1 unnamed protein product [Oppiella nova]
MESELIKWPIARHHFGLKDIEEIYDSNDWKNICLFRSNIKTSDHLTLLKKMRSNKVFQENCDQKTEKQMRKYYKRPEIVPSMLELTKSNWILVSQNYTGLQFKLIDPSPGTQALLMIQIRGENRIKAEPKEFCASRGCGSVEDTLRPNEMCMN